MKKDRTIVVAITGGIGSGKSSVLSMMEDLGARILDANKLAREAISKGSPAYLAIVERYGSSLLDQNKEIDRSALASIAFDSDDERLFIEGAIHPFVRNEINRLAAEFSKMGAKVVAVEIPLLFEVGWEKEFDAVITVVTNEDEGLRRFCKKRNIPTEEAKKRLKAQIPIEIKAKKSDFVINNDGTPEKTRFQVASAFKKLV